MAPTSSKDGRDDEDSGGKKKVCGYCEVGVKSKFKKCKDCGTCYHNSCSERVSVRDKPGKFICCAESEVMEELEDSIAENKGGKACESDAFWRENLILRKLVKELEDKNKLLAEKVSVLESKLSGKKEERTYADAMKGERSYQYTRNLVHNIPAIIVKPKQHEESSTTRKHLLQTVKPADFGIPVKKMVDVKNGSVVINCELEKDVAVLRREIEKNVGAQYSVVQEELKHPRIKIVGINEKYTMDELRDTIVNQNSYIDNPEEIEIMHCKYWERIKKYTAYAVVAPKIYHRMIDNASISVGWEKCRVFEDYNVNRCYKCCGYNHRASKCENLAACNSCGGKHDSNECTNSELKKCVNCEKSNVNFKTKFDINHAAYEVSKCATYNMLVRKAKTRIDYGERGGMWS